MPALTLSSDQGQRLADALGLAPPYEDDAADRLFRALMAVETPDDRYAAFAAATGVEPVVSAAEEIGDLRSADDTAYALYAGATGVRPGIRTRITVADKQPEPDEFTDADEWTAEDERAYGSFAAQTLGVEVAG